MTIPYSLSHLQFQSFFCWKGHQINDVIPDVPEGIGFNPFSAGRGIKSFPIPSLFTSTSVSILFLLEGASNPDRVQWRVLRAVFQSFFCWKGHQIVVTPDMKALPVLFQSFFCWKGHQIGLAFLIAGSVIVFQSFFCWKGHQIHNMKNFQFIPICFNPFSAGRGIKSSAT